MRVLQVIQELGVGGAERVVRALVLGANDAGHVSAVLAAPGPLDADLPAERYALPMLQRRPWRIPAAAFAVDRALRDFQPDVLHCHNPGVAIAVGLATARGRRVPGLVSVHGVPDADYSAAARLLQVSGMPVISCGPGVTAGLADAGLRVYTTVVNGIAPAPPPADGAQVRRDWGLPADASLVLVVGRLAPIKNPVLAVRAIADLPDVTLAFVGDGPLRTELARLAEEEGVSARVIFAGARADARELIAAADAVALTSHAEGLPLVALEALAAGTPLVATAVRGVRELLHDEHDCLLVAPDDSHALAVALRRALTDDALRRTLAEHGRALAARHTEAAMVGRFLQLYDEARRP